jgi:hypothetical protein
VGVVPWTAFDEGYLRAYQWSGALAGGARMPQGPAAVQLGPGEVAHARFEPVGVLGHFGEHAEYQRSFLLVGGPVGLALTGAASLARNASKKAAAQRAATPRWHRLGTVDLVVTNQRLVVTGNGQTGSFWYAQTTPLQLMTGPGGVPTVQFQPSGQPMLRLESPFMPMLYVFVHHLVDGRPPGVPIPPDLLERAKAAGRLE